MQLKMEKQEFFIYKFAKKDYRIILPKWVNVRNKDLCWYPPYKVKANIEKCLIDSAQPDPATWKKLYLYKKIATMTNLIEAKEFLSTIQNMFIGESKVDDENLETPRNLRHKRKLSAENAESELALAFYGKSEMPGPSKKWKPNHNNDVPQIKDEPEDSDTEMIDIETKPKLRKLSKIDTSEMSIREMFAVLFEFNNLMMEKVDQTLNIAKRIEKRLELIENRKAMAKQPSSNEEKPVVNNPDDVDDVQDFLPLLTMKNFNYFETKLNEKNFFYTAARYMKSIGGDTLHDLIRQIMDRFMGDGLAIRFNVDGKAIVRKNSVGEVLQPKQSFAKTKLFKCIMKAASMKNNDEVDEKKLRTRTIGPWLAGARQRLERESKKNTQQ